MFNHILSSFKHKELSEEQLVGEKLSNVIENRYMVNFYILSFIVWLIVRNMLNL
jgi:hypothetical protein